MSFKWPSKDPDEVLDYSVDWSRWLNNATILTCDWYVDNENGIKTLIVPSQVVNNVQNVSQSVTSTVATIYIGLGTANVEYKFYCKISTSAGSVVERVVRLKIKEQ